MVKAVIFDFDGVIGDTLDLIFSINKKLFPEITLEDYKNLFNGNIYKKGNFTSESIKEFYKYQNEEFKTLIIKDSVKTELNKINKEFPIYIISSNQEYALNLVFENNHMTNVFTQVLGMETEKSKVKKFEILLNSQNIKSEDCIFITDTLGDIKKASKLNIKTIAVDFGFHERARLEQGNPFKIVSNFNEIYPLIQTLK
ncbi:HAD family hydrolase [Candidatus Woesearchaeota archaeon]|jgi:phosphoglycolate phosphatase|nr:HAD family hydrolase [Candidatus Woesearchaeota archaeon]MBT4150529.1 HAD family hydrolase [Candidatus Woesearchaeota archaeon]MBT4247170.1 HAD family hydrolase [Candidatus Woesearchaeota archaeon]MBT4434605.1 HAD family hydrolase [Candidatus Woesearchaeota archaeon]MBT7332544.1 HAD family hydrolase [Candidatus Woesearchaeota archaeon]